MIKISERYGKVLFQATASETVLPVYFAQKLIIDIEEVIEKIMKDKKGE